MQLIDYEVAQSDPRGQAFFGYQATPCQGYYYTVMPSWRMTPERTADLFKRYSITVTWNGKKANCLPARYLPDLAAFPEDKAMPTYLWHDGRVYQKRLDGRDLPFVPRDLELEGWQPVKCRIDAVPPADESAAKP